MSVSTVTRLPPICRTPPRGLPRGGRGRGERCWPLCRLELPRPGEHVVDAAHHEERLLRQVVHLTINHHLERADRLIQGHGFARDAGDGLAPEEGWRQEPLKAAGPADRKSTRLNSS